MKFHLIVLSSVILAASCNTQPKTDNVSKDSTTLTTDTTGLAAFQAMKAQNELGVKNDEAQKENKAPEETVKKTKTTTHSSSTASTATKPESGSNTSTTSGTEEKKGWSKTAKGAVIGGVVGAGTGAVINKKNRAAGAVIGGVLGAGTGAVIGNKMDKKDGGH